MRAVLCARFQAAAGSVPVRPSLNSSPSDHLDGKHITFLSGRYARAFRETGRRCLRTIIMKNRLINEEFEIGIPNRYATEDCRAPSRCNSVLGLPVSRRVERLRGNSTLRAIYEKSSTQLYPYRLSSIFSAPELFFNRASVPTGYSSVGVTGRETSTSRAGPIITDRRYSRFYLLVLSMLNTDCQSIDYYN